MEYSKKKNLKFYALTKAIKSYPVLYLLLVPSLIYLLLFKWLPLLGIIIAFQDYNPFLGIFQSPWVGLKHFKGYFSDPYFYILLRNTFLLAVSTIVFSFPVPLIFSLLLNEVRQKYIKKVVQSFSFLPYFISSAVTVSIAYTFLSPQGGIINNILNLIGIDSIYFMSEPGWFRPLYVILNIWNTTGYVAIIYLAAMTTIDPMLYEVADLDGAGRWRKMLYITLPSISNIIIMMLIINLGAIVSIDLNKVLIMYNPSIYDTADVIETYVYRQAFQSMGFPQYSFGAALGIFQSVMGTIMVLFANNVVKKYFDTRLF